MIFGHDLSFWIAIAGATIVKLLTSPYSSFMRAVLTVVAAVFSAWAFTEPALDWLGLNPATYKTPMAALLALTGEGLIRILMAGSNDPIKIMEWWRAWRGR